MLRIANTNIDEKKQARFALTAIRGIGKNNVKFILQEVDIKPEQSLGELEEAKIVELRGYIDSNITTEDDLRRQRQGDISRLIRIGCWRGLRHKAHLPVRGQTTKTNSRTVRGNKRFTSGSGKGKPAQKT